MTTSIVKDKVFERRRPPKVRIFYEVEFLSGLKVFELPFVMGVMADLAGESQSQEARKPVEERDFVEVDAVGFGDFMANLAPRATARVRNRLPIMEGETVEAELEIDLTFRSMRDFSPDAIAQQVPAVAQLLGWRSQLIELLAYLEREGDARKQIDSRLSGQSSNGDANASVDSTFASEPDVRTLANSSDSDMFWQLLGLDLESNSAAIREFKARLKSGYQAGFKNAEPAATSSDLFSLVNSIVASLDRYLSAQVNEIMQCDAVRKIEGTWRGLHYLVNNTESSLDLKIRAMNISKQDLTHNLANFEGEMWDQSPIFKKIYTARYMPGGEPFGALIGDYEFSHEPSDIELLRSLSRISATAHAPFIAAVSPALFNLERWDQLLTRGDLRQMLSSAGNADWQRLREAEECCYIGLAMPRVLARLPYGSATVPAKGFSFEEEIEGKDNDYVWMNAAFVMGVNINWSFYRFGWPTQIRGLESGGSVLNVPVHAFRTQQGSLKTKGPTEIVISDDRLEATLARLGLMPIMNDRNNDRAAFIGAHSLQDDDARAGRFVDPDEHANARLSANLPYLFAVCRFAHYLKVIARDNFGTFKEPEEMQARLNEWVDSYVLANPAMANENAMAKQPLTYAQVQIDNVEVRPGYIAARFYLRPYYQHEGINATLRLVSELPQPPNLDN